MAVDDRFLECLSIRLKIAAASWILSSSDFFAAVTYEDELDVRNQFFGEYRIEANERTSAKCPSERHGVLISSPANGIEVSGGRKSPDSS